MIAWIVALPLLTLSTKASMSCYELDPRAGQKTVALDDCLSVLDTVLAVNNFSEPIAFNTSAKGAFGVPCTWHSGTCEISVDLTDGYDDGEISRSDIAKTAVAILRACTIPNGEANIGGQATTGLFSEFLVSLGPFTPKHYKGFSDGHPPGPHGIKRSQKRWTV
ncbi:MAG: hypothetical protein Q9191_006704 [Dirinaria sp. TL-2023a]